MLPTERLREVMRQLHGIGGGRSLGFGPNRVRSLPDGIGQVLDRGRGRVQLVTAIGTRRLMDLPDGDQLPRIC